MSNHRRTMLALSIAPGIPDLHVNVYDPVEWWKFLPSPIGKRPSYVSMMGRWARDF